MKPLIKILDVITNQEIEREMTDEELSAHNAFIKSEKERLELENIKKINRESALAKLASLGLTEDEIAAL